MRQQVNEVEAVAIKANHLKSRVRIFRWHVPNHLNKCVTTLGAHYKLYSGITFWFIILVIPNHLIAKCIGLVGKCYKCFNVKVYADKLPLFRCAPSLHYRWKISVRGPDGAMEFRRCFTKSLVAILNPLFKVCKPNMVLIGKPENTSVFSVPVSTENQNLGRGHKLKVNLDSIWYGWPLF